MCNNDIKCKDSLIFLYKKKISREWVNIYRIFVLFATDEFYVDFERSPEGKDWGPFYKGLMSSWTKSRKNTISFFSEK